MSGFQCNEKHMSGTGVVNVFEPSPTSDTGCHLVAIEAASKRVRARRWRTRRLHSTIAGGPGRAGPGEKRRESSKQTTGRDERIDTARWARWRWVAREHGVCYWSYGRAYAKHVMDERACTTSGRL